MPGRAKQAVQAQAAVDARAEAAGQEERAVKDRAAAACAEAEGRRGPAPEERSPLGAILGGKAAHTAASASGKEIVRSLFGTRRRR